MPYITTSGLVDDAKAAMSAAVDSTKKYTKLPALPWAPTPIIAQPPTAAPASATYGVSPLRLALLALGGYVAWKALR